MDDPTVVLESLGRPVPTVWIERGKGFGWKGTVYDGADFAKGRGATSSEDLHGYVSNGGRFDWTCMHWLAGGVSGELIEEMVFRSAADDANFFYRPADQLLEVLNDKPVLEGEAFENGAHVSAMGSRHGLVGALAEGVDCSGHVGWTKKGLVIRVEEGSKGSFARSHFEQFDIFAGLPLSQPNPAAFLKHPQPHDIL